MASIVGISWFQSRDPLTDALFGVSYGHGSPLTAQMAVIGPTDPWNYMIDCYIHCRIMAIVVRIVMRPM